MIKGIINTTKARSILGASATSYSDIELVQLIHSMELISEIIINETYGSKNKSVLDFMNDMNDNGR